MWIELPIAFQVHVLEIQPSQLFINWAKYTAVERLFLTGEFTGDYSLPVIKMNDHLVLTDGHTRALVL